MRGGERSFRYASLASGLDLVRKCLGQYKIALIQTTAVDQGQITLTTLLVHASGEWVSSVWPVCAAAEPSAQIKGAALTYARRYALFTLVGIAGEDDLDAPEPFQAPQLPIEPPVKGHNGRTQSSRPPTLTPKESATLRDRLIGDIPAVSSEEALALWAHRSLPLKNTLTAADAQAVEVAYLARLTACAAEASSASAPPSEERPEVERAEVAAAIAIPKTLRKRNKAHLAFVASQACLICRVTPCDAHHLKIAQPRSLGRKVSDEFTVPLCRQHHRELHRHGNEANWWANMQVAPIPVAKELWEQSQLHDTSKRWAG
jgi:hypothetical protein